MNTKKYIKSQRLTYLALGLVAGYFGGLGKDNYGDIIVLVIVVLAVGLSYWFGRRDKNN